MLIIRNTRGKFRIGKLMIIDNKSNADDECLAVNLLAYAADSRQMYGFS